MSILNFQAIDTVSIDGGGLLIIPPIPTPDEPHSAIYNDYVIDCCDINGGYVPWHPVTEARAIYAKGFIATKFGRAFLWREDSPSGECMTVPCVPDEVCVPCVPDELVVAPVGGKQC